MPLPYRRSTLLDFQLRASAQTSGFNSKPPSQPNDQPDAFSQHRHGPLPLPLFGPRAARTLPLPVCDDGADDNATIKFCLSPFSFLQGPTTSLFYLVFQLRPLLLGFRRFCPVVSPVVSPVPGRRLRRILRAALLACGVRSSLLPRAPPPPAGAYVHELP